VRLAVCVTVGVGVREAVGVGVLVGVLVGPVPVVITNCGELAPSLEEESAPSVEVVVTRRL
jgi:hypothetical protein